MKYSLATYCPNTMNATSNDAVSRSYSINEGIACGFSGWLSVDPMSDRYPSISSYNYCAWNPVGLTDPHRESVRLTADSWKCLRYGLDNILENKSPFTINNSGFLIFDEELLIPQENNLNDDQKDVINRLKELAISKDIRINVQICDRNSPIIDEESGRFTTGDL